MDAAEIASLKEQIFSGQSPTQSPTPVSIVPEVTPETPTIPIEPELPVTPVIATGDTPAPEEIETVDANEYLKSNLGYDSWEVAKAEIERLKSTPVVKFEDEQAERIYNLLKDGKKSEVKAFLELQERLSDTDALSPEDAIKLNIEQSNKHFKKADVEDVFEEKYAKPAKPVQTDLEDETEYNDRLSQWQQTIEKIDRRIQRDAIAAKEELLKHKTNLVLPDITKDEGYEAYKAAIAEQQEIAKVEATTKEAYSKLSPKDISFNAKFNDEANKLAFDFAFEPDKKSFDESVSFATDLPKLFESYYDKDGNPNRTKYLQDLYNGRNIEKIVTAAMVQASNETRRQMLANSKNITNPTQRNYSAVVPDEIQRIREQVFGKVS
jgi:hypothetical protein